MIATVGTFDGVHRGHLFLLRKLAEAAELLETDSCVVTFRNHPSEILSPTPKKRLISATEKERLILEAGINTVLFFTFDSELRRLSSLEFARQLREQYGITAFLVGHDNRFGSDVNVDFNDFVATLAADGFKVLVVKQQFSDISSTAIRRDIARGDVVAAERKLGRLYSLEGIVCRGKGIGHTIGFPTANVVPEEKKLLIPADGVYAARARFDGMIYGAMVNIGHRPTVEADADAPTSIEANIFDFNGNLYGKSMEIYFVERVRSEQRFSDINALQEQLRIDVISVREILHNRIVS